MHRAKASATVRQAAAIETLDLGALGAAQKPRHMTWRIANMDKTI
jgi:hypothetical protein